MELAKKLFKGDFRIWFIFLGLAGISIIEGYSAMSTLAYKQEYFWMPIWRHITFLLTGMAIMVSMSQLHYQKIAKGLLLLYPVALLMLILTPILGLEVNGAHRWMFGLQPSEFGKLAVIGFVALILSREKIDINQRFWVTLIGSGIVCGLILPENFSTAGLLFLITYFVMFIARMPFKKMFILTASGLGMVILFLIFLLNCPDSLLKNAGRLPTWKSRIVEYVENRNSGDEEKERSADFYGDKYQVTQAKIAIAHGGLIGQFPGHGQQREFLPQAFSDFIYAIIIEEMGLFGGILVMGLYIILLIRAGIIARKCRNNYPKYLLLASALMIVVQAMVNMAVAVDLMPVTGQPLPLISRGGTSVLVTCVYFGIILSVSQSLKEQQQREALAALELEKESLEEEGETDINEIVSEEALNDEEMNNEELKEEEDIAPVAEDEQTQN